MTTRLPVRPHDHEVTNPPRLAWPYREGAMIRPTMTSLVLAGLLLTTACGTTVQPGQRGLFWRPFTEGLSPKR